MADDKGLEKDLSDVIKNPNRHAPTVRSRYEPEYMRLNAEPILRDIHVHHPNDQDLKNLAETNERDAYISINDESFDQDGNNIDVQGHIIDNNDYVSFGPFESARPTVPQAPPPQTSESSTPEIGEYILMVFGKLIASGSLEAIEKRVKGIIYSEDQSFKGLEVGLDDIIVLKRVALKIGVFIDD